MTTTINNTDVLILFSKKPSGYGQYIIETKVTILDTEDSEIFNQRITDMEIIDNIDQLISDGEATETIESYYFNRIFCRIQKRVDEWMMLMLDNNLSN